MLLLLSGLLCASLCGGAAQRRSPRTKAAFSAHDSAAAEWNALPLTRGAGGGLRGPDLRGSGPESPTRSPAGRFGPQTLRGAVRQSVRRRRATEAGDERSPRGLGPGPPWAQEQEAGAPAGLNLSDYGDQEPDYAAPDEPGPSPPPPVEPRSRRRPLKNPFYPLGAEAAGAYAVTLVSAVLFGVGVVGNVSVMCAVCHDFRLRSVSSSLLAGLALWDFGVLFLCLPLVLFHQLTGAWLLGPLSCRIVPYLEVASLGVTTFTLCALCIDRFRAATNVQLYYEMTENWASTSAKLAVIWVGAMLLALPELLIRQLLADAGEAGEAGVQERCLIRISTQLPDSLYVLGLTYDSARLWWCFGCYFCLPTLFTIVSSLLTARKMRGGAERARGRASRKQMQLESQMNCVVVALAILYGFCTVPENLCNMLGAYMAASVAPPTLRLLQLLSQLLLFCKAAAAPVLLLSLCRPFSRAFLDCCCCCFQECHPQRSAAAAAAERLELPPLSAAADSAAVGTRC